VDRFGSSELTRTWVRDMKVESRALCGAGWHTGWQQLATRLFVAWAGASVGPVAAPERPSATRPQDAILPHKRPSGLAFLRLNHADLHFHVAHPPDVREPAVRHTLRYTPRYTLGTAQDAIGSAWSSSGDRRR
jgi:hypothetical protein